MKKILSLFALLSLLLALSSCLVPMDTEPSDGFPSVTFPPDTSEDAPPITYLYGNWRTDAGADNFESLHRPGCRRYGSEDRF